MENKVKVRPSIPGFLRSLPHAPTRANRYYFETCYVTAGGKLINVHGFIKGLRADPDDPARAKGVLASLVNNPPVRSARPDGCHLLLASRLEEGTRRYLQEKQESERATRRQVAYAERLDTELRGSGLHWELPDDLVRERQDTPWHEMTKPQISEHIGWMRSLLGGDL